MKLTINSLIALLALFFAQTVFACDEPDRVKIPNGRNATADEMATADKAFHAYMNNMQSYQACLAADADQPAVVNDGNKAALIAREKTSMNRHNRASTAMKKATADFNEAVEQYEARQ